MRLSRKDRPWKFRAKFDFPYRLLSDPEHVLAKAYGSWIEKKLYGRNHMGIDRSTFLVGADGVVQRSWRGVKVKGHVDEVRAAAEGGE